MTSTAPLKDLALASLAEKAEILQRFYEQVCFHPGGIIYSMQRMNHETVRPFVPDDFNGQYKHDFSKWGRHRPDGDWDYFHGENSITTSGHYLAAQSYRYKATNDPEALQEARKAFRSVELIYELGVQDGRPGWMGKPYSWRVSDQTSADQYVDVTNGLFAYHGIAPPADKARIEAMVVGFADYWRRADYTQEYFGYTMSMRGTEGWWGAIFMMINALAYHFTRSSQYLEEANKIYGWGAWDRETQMDVWKREHRKGKKPEQDTWFNEYMEEDETFCVETHCRMEYLFISLDIVLAVAPEILKRGADRTIALWWPNWRYSFSEDLLPYYSILRNLKTGAWRPTPRTPLLPKEEWQYGSPFSAYLSQVRAPETLAMLMGSALIAVKHAPSVAEEAGGLLRRLMESVDEIRLRHMVDPDGQQLIPEISLCGEVLSSQMPGRYLATYWRGRCENRW